MDKDIKIFAVIFFILITFGIGTVFLVHYFIEDEKPIILDFLPKPNKYKNSDSRLIWTNRLSEQNESAWGTQLTKFIEKYADSSIWEENARLCSYENGLTATNATYCIVEVDHIEHTMSAPHISFGYAGRIGKPSVLLMLKNRDGWVPEPYTLEDLEKAENYTEMPTDLQTRIKNNGTVNQQYLIGRLNTTWISCEGVKPADKENIGPITFYAPGMGSQNFPGIPNYYFPYLEQAGYQTPFVVVQFRQLRANVVVGVECRAWAKNIGSDDDDERGFVGVEFEILIDG